MYYVKVLETTRDLLEQKLNEFYSKTQERGHRVMFTKPHWFEDGTVDVMMVVSDKLYERS